MHRPGALGVQEPEKEKACENQTLIWNRGSDVYLRRIVDRGATLGRPKPDRRHGGDLNAAPIRGQGSAPQFADHEHHGTPQQSDQRVLAQDQALGRFRSMSSLGRHLLKEAEPRLKPLKHIDQLRALQVTPFEHVQQQ